MENIKNKKEYKIFISTRNEELDKKIRSSLIRHFGSISKGGFTLLLSFADPEFCKNLIKIEELKRDNEIMKFRTEQIKQLERENKLLSRRLIEIEKELEKYKIQKKGAIK
jgi:hypothetical protein